MTFIIRDPKAESFNYTLDLSSVELTALVDKLFDEIKLNRHKVHKNGLKLILLNLIVHKGLKVFTSSGYYKNTLYSYISPSCSPSASPP